MGLLGGEYYKPEEDGGNLPAYEGRRHFLEAVAEQIPQVIEALRDEVLPLYPAGADGFDALLWIGPVEVGTYSLPVERVLLRWARRYHLAERWILNAALETLSVWKQYGHYSGHFFGAVPMIKVEPFPPFRFDYSGWPVQWETRGEATEHITRGFRAALEEYLDAVEAEAEAAGMIRTPTKRARRGSPPDRYFEWLARFQVQEATHAEIAERYGVTVKVVAAGCRSAAELIGLKRRSV